jgi:hypothetical protein
MHCRNVISHGRPRQQPDATRDEHTLVSRQQAFKRIFVMRLIRPHPEYPATSAAALTAEAAKPPAKVAESGQKHLDYNLQPLSVDSFSHYINAVVDLHLHSEYSLVDSTIRIKAAGRRRMRARTCRR